MVTKKQRKMIDLFLRIGIWQADINMRLIWLRPRRGFEWTLRWMLKRQKVDDLKHAPCCPANHYHNTRLVFQRCTCGAR